MVSKMLLVAAAACLALSGNGEATAMTRGGARELQNSVCAACDVPCSAGETCTALIGEVSASNCLYLSCLPSSSGGIGGGFNDGLNDFNDLQTSVLQAYTGVLIFCAIYWVLSLILVVATIICMKNKEAELPPHLQTLDCGMVAAWVLISLCCGLLGWAIMFCVVQSRINQNLLMHQASGGAGPIAVK